MSLDDEPTQAERAGATIYEPHAEVQSSWPRAILPEAYDFLSNRQSTFEQQENMAVVPNYDAPTPEQLAVEDAAWDAITEKHKDTLGIISRLVLENAELRSRLSSVEQELDEARKALAGVRVVILDINEAINGETRTGWTHFCDASIGRAIDLLDAAAP